MLQSAWSGLARAVVGTGRTLDAMITSGSVLNARRALDEADDRRRAVASLEALLGPVGRTPPSSGRTGAASA